jgi:hypothetical protein
MIYALFQNTIHSLIADETAEGHVQVKTSLYAAIKIAHVLHNLLKVVCVIVNFRV